MEFSEELAEILGLLCAEGCYVNTRTTYWEFDKERGKKYLKKNKLQRRIEFGNKNQILLNHFVSLLEKEFSYSPKPGKDRVRICKRNIIDAILSFTEIGHLNWKVPKNILKGDLNLKRKFLRGFFEGDGTISNRIRLFSTNYSGLKQVSLLLEDLRIIHKFKENKVTGNRKPCFEIYIFENQRESFLKEIKPLTKRPDYVGIT